MDFDWQWKRRLPKNVIYENFKVDNDAVCTCYCAITRMYMGINSWIDRYVTLASNMDFIWPGMCRELVLFHTNDRQSINGFF